MVNRSSFVRATLLAAILTIGTARCRDADTPTAPAAPPGAGPSLAAPTLDAGVLAATEVLVGAGNIAACTNDVDEATALLLDGIPGTVFTAGDNAYPDGTDADFANCYEPTWGRHKARTRPAAGTKEYSASNGVSHWRYFGAAAGDSAKFYYSYDVGDWHVVVLNTKTSTSATSAQLTWLRADLATSGKQCTIAIFNKPRFSTASGVTSGLKPIWDVLYSFGVELAVNGYNRYYERFAPQDPDGAADPNGIRQIIAGTGGAGTTSFGTPLPNSEVRNTGTAGVLKLALGAGSYRWDFVPVAGKTFTDTGTGTCHPAPPPIARPGGPYAGEGPIAFDGRASSDPQGQVITGYEWDFGDGTTGTGAQPSHAYAADGVYTVTLVVRDATGNPSAPATTTATISNQPPVVSAGADQTVVIGSPVMVTVAFTDPGTNDGPWTYQLSWGDGSPDASGTVNAQGGIGLMHTYAALGTYAVSARVTDKDGASGLDDATVTVRAWQPGAVILAAGDIATCTKERDEYTARILDSIPGTVFTLGDNVYEKGTTAEYANCYHPTWGRHLGRTYATLGNHEYETPGALPSYDYFGARAGPRTKGFYSVDIGDWHIIVLNDNISIKAGSEQDLWLQADLASNTKACTMAMWHQPRFMSANDTFTDRTSRKILWDRLYAAGADVVLAGHQHFYERMRPQDPAGNLDEARGIVQFIVGTGGESSKLPTATIRPNSVVRSDHFGVLKMTLHANSYDWLFIPALGYSFMDSGTATCH